MDNAIDILVYWSVGQSVRWSVPLSPFGPFRAMFKTEKHFVSQKISFKRCWINDERSLRIYIYILFLLSTREYSVKKMA